MRRGSSSTRARTGGTCSRTQSTTPPLATSTAASWRRDQHVGVGAWPDQLQPTVKGRVAEGVLQREALCPQAELSTHALPRRVACLREIIRSQQEISTHSALGSALVPWVVCFLSFFRRLSTFFLSVKLHGKCRRHARGQTPPSHR